eukprot:2234915-Amphidinium_carterae.1
MQTIWNHTRNQGSRIDHLEQLLRNQYQILRSAPASDIRSNAVPVLLDAYIMTTEKFAMMAEDRDADDIQPKSTDNTESLEDLKMK